MLLADVSAGLIVMIVIHNYWALLRECLDQSQISPVMSQQSAVMKIFAEQHQTPPGLGVISDIFCNVSS